MLGSKLLIAVMTLCLASCAPTVEGSQAKLDEFARLLERTFETAPDNAESQIRDKRVSVGSEALSGYWFYTQLNTGKDRKLYRQRISHIKLSDDRTTIIQKTYGLNDPEKYIDAWKTAALLKSLTRADFESYFSEGCEQVWTPVKEGAWSGYVDPQTCVISSKRRNKDIRIESEAYLSNDIYRTNERGYDMDMTFLWGTKPGDYIDLYPVP